MITMTCPVREKDILPFLLDPPQSFLQVPIQQVASVSKRESSIKGLLLLLLSRFSRVRLCDPIGGSPLGSSVPGLLQATILEWVAISFSNAWK